MVSAPKGEVTVTHVQVHAVLFCDEPECEILYEWTGETAEQCEAFLKAILEVHKQLWHPR